VKAAELYLQQYETTYNELGLAQSKLWQPGTLCITIAANIAESAILAIPGCFPDSVVGFVADPKVADTKFVKYKLDTLKLAMQSASLGTTQDNLSLDKLLRFDFLIPTLLTQQRIAAILSAYDDLIENNTRRIAILEEMARRLYEEWFVHFRFPGHEGVEFGETELGRTPSDWLVQTVSETFDITGGGTPSKKICEYWADGTIAWFSPTDVTRAGTTFMDASSSKITELGLKKSSARLFPPFSVMMTSRATIGAIAINPTEACTNQGFITCIPNDSFPLYILLHWLRDNVDMFISLASGATFKEISKGVFKEIKLLVPPKDIADRFEQTVGPMMQQALVLQRKNANLRAQRDLLLPKLVSGEIDVSAAGEALEAAE
jgi:type I restriction enzyme S subunit